MDASYGLYRIRVSAIVSQDVVYESRLLSDGRDAIKAVIAHGLESFELHIATLSLPLVVLLE